MNKLCTLIFLLSSFHMQSNNRIYDLPTKDDSNINPNSQWAIVGAGPAGITIIGLLLDLGVDPHNINWIDPEFNVGRLGKYYGCVPANVPNNSFIRFMESCKTFMSCESQALDDLFNKYDPEVEHPLQVVIDPLQDITDFLKTKVNAIEDVLTSLHFENDLWHISTKKQSLTASHVVLATGSHPRTLEYKECSNQIPLDLALNKCNLAQLVEPMDSVAVVGSSHSAILLLKFLSELNVMRIINFYTRPLIYDRDEVGLLGETAEFAKNVLEKNPPAHLLRMCNTPEARKAWLPICNKIIYAIGYTQNSIPLEGHITNCIQYDDTSGTIGPRLFGIGIAFPETFYDEETCTHVNKVGLVGFMEYAQRVLPEWIATKEPINRFASFENLFSVDSL